MSVRPRSPASVSAVWTAPTARIEGTGSRSVDSDASLTRRISTPRLARRDRHPPRAPRVPRRGRGRRRRPARSHRARARAARRPAATSSRPSRSATTGRSSRSVRGERGGPPSSAGRRPSSTRRSMTTRSRSGSMARVRDLGERLAEVVGHRSVQSARDRGRRVVAHAPERLVTFERHRLDIEPCLLGVEPGDSAAGRTSGPRPRSPRQPRRCRPRGSDAAGRGSAGGGGRAPWHRCPRGSPAPPGSTSSISPGPSRPRRTVSAGSNGTAPASDATATSRSLVTAKAAGRSPLRSTSAPTRRPSAKTIAAGPSQGASIPAVRRRSVATCGCGARRSPTASGIAASSAGRQLPAGRRQELQALVERKESEPSGESSGPASSSVGRDRRPRRGRACGPGPAPGCRGPC